MAGEYFALKTGAKLNHIPYRGSGPALTDVIGGSVPLIFSDLFAVQVRIQSGDLRLIATTGRHRASSAPDVATVIEQGVDDFEVTGWTGLLAPAGVSPEILEFLNRECNVVLRSEETARRFGGVGPEMVGGTGTEFMNKVRTEIIRWKRVIEAAQIAAPN
jgi:tripartite-type tricarboxylate transporter receptor subunit TctC